MDSSCGTTAGAIIVGVAALLVALVPDGEILPPAFWAPSTLHEGLAGRSREPGWTLLWAVEVRIPSLAACRRT